MTAGTIPSFTSVNPNVASLAATAMSAHAASPEPPPSANPWMRATTGAGQRSIVSHMRYSLRASSTLSSYDRSIAERCQSMSAPAQNGSPSPASTTARTSPTSAKASVRSAISCASKALRRSGRASATRTTSPVRSTRSPPMGLQLRVEDMLRGALAAALTPLKDAGEALDVAAIAPYVDFLVAGGVDGLLALGTTGEGFLLPLEQRLRGAQLFVDHSQGRLAVAVHAGAQSTWDTLQLAAHAADIGADGVAVIAPPYFALDESEVFEHLAAAARACEPTPFYVYEFAARSGYPVPLSVLDRLREAAPNFRGLKVSDVPWERFAPYLVEGLDVFVG